MFKQILAKFCPDTYRKLMKVTVRHERVYPNLAGVETKQKNK
ncbi:MAG: hypothetical protein QNJ18_12165 [Xenococcaceae cyanobacterium MO_167.B52]|nr:hypothetical protein [Xenococcaceae cyanobacterium MO_167.B52]